MHDLRVEPVRPGLENSVAFTRAKLFFLSWLLTLFIGEKVGNTAPDLLDQRWS